MASDCLAANVRFSWLRSDNSGLYLPHNKVDDRCDFPLRSRQEVVLKIQLTFNCVVASLS